MSYSTPYPPAPPAPGDFVRCVSEAGWRDGPFPLTVGNTYQVRATTPAADFDALATAQGPYVHLHGYTQAFLAARFDVAIRGARNDNLCEAVVIPHQMARLMREMAAAGGGCTLDDLARAGFTAAQIAEYLPDARAIAGPASAHAPGEVA